MVDTHMLLGFAQNVATYDSLGIVRSLMPHSDHIWVPMLDSRMAKGDKVESYWPVGLTDKEFMCVIVKVSCYLAKVSRLHLT